MRLASNPPPVSGEIVTAGAPWARAAVDMRAAADADVVDAEFETLSPQRVAAPAPPLPAQTPVLGLDMLRSQEKGKTPQRGGPAFWLFGLTAAAAAFWISGGHSLVDASALLASNDAGGLRVSSLQSRVEPGPEPVLYVDADLVNESGEALALPPIGIDVVDGEGRTRRYLLGTSGASVAAGESFGFSSRLIAPKSGVESVSVSFGSEE